MTPFLTRLVMTTLLICPAVSRAEDGRDILLHQLPPLLQFQDDRPVQTVEDWLARRQEIRNLLLHYVYGHSPDQPDVVRAEVTQQGPIPVCEGTEQRITLIIGSDEQLPMRIAVYRPEGPGPFPVIIREEHALGHLQEVPAILARNYLFVEYAREDLDPDAIATVGAAQQAYPQHDWATLAVWAWGAMRVVDYLESRTDILPDQIAVAGHSRGGKTALLAGAMDKRFAVVLANGSGAGGAGSFHYQPRRVETLELITQPKRFGYWFHPRLRTFAGREHELPVDQHMLKAMVAPRALLCTEARGDQWANPDGTRLTSRVADEVFEFLQVPDNNALHFREGNHDLLPEDWQVMLDFADWQFRGQRPEHSNQLFQHRSAAP